MNPLKLNTDKDTVILLKILMIYFTTLGIIITGMAYHLIPMIK